jgi:hypothetical protein
VPLCAFTWGFVIDKAGATPNIIEPEPLPIATWAEHVRLLEESHPAWRFRRER